MTTFQKTFLLTQVLILALASGFAAGYFWRSKIAINRDPLPILYEALDILSKHALKPLPDDRSLEYGMIRGMLQAYGDPYTVFVEPAQHELESNELHGSFGGIGVRIVLAPDDYPLLYPFPDGPAKSAGIHDGDRLLAVDELKITPDTPLETIQAALRGEVGTRVRILILRSPNSAPLEFVIKRQEISLPSVTWHQHPAEPRLGVLEINLISSNTPDEVLEAARDLRNRGVSSFVIDLRGNSGGLLEAGVDVARLFLTSGVVLQRQYRNQELETYSVERPGALADIPLAVLVNQEIASAAEIIAGALQAHGRARLIGTPTFGKDTIQLVFELQDQSSLHVTAGHWWIPGLQAPISEGGLQPDVYIEAQDDRSASGDAQLQAAIEVLFSDN